MLKWCDYMELVLWCLEEVQAGNMYASQPAGRALHWMLTRPNLQRVSGGAFPLTLMPQIIINRAVDTARKLGMKV